MTEQKRTENIVNELSPDELNSVTGGTGKTPPKPTTPEPPTPKEQVTFEYGGLVVQYVQQSIN